MTNPNGFDASDARGLEPDERYELVGKARVDDCLISSLEHACLSDPGDFSTGTLQTGLPGRGY